MYGPQLPPMTDDERREARLEDMKRHIAELQQQVDDLEGRPSTGKQKMMESITEANNKEPSSPSPPAASSPRSSRVDPPIPKIRLKIRDPGPSNQPGSFPEPNTWHNPALMKRMFVDECPNLSGQPAQQDHISQHWSEYWSRGRLDMESAAGPRTGSPTRSRVQPDWDEPLFLHTPQRDMGYGDDCIIIGGRAADDMDFDSMDGNSEESEASSEEDDTANGPG